MTSAERAAWDSEWGDWVLDTDTDRLYQGRAGVLGGNLVGPPIGGFENYEDAVTSSTPLVVPASTWTTVPNDGLGSQTNTEEKPPSVSRLFDVSNGALDISDLKKGDQVTVRYDFVLTPSANGSFASVRLMFGDLFPFTLTSIIGTLSNSAGTEYPYSEIVKFFVGEDDMRLAPILLQIHCSQNATLVNRGVFVSVDIK